MLPPFTSQPGLNPADLTGRNDILSTLGRTPAFGQMMAQVTQRPGLVQVQAGDTLIGLVKAQYAQNQLPISEGQAMRLAHQVAAHNGIGNPNMIKTGQKVDFSGLPMSDLLRAGYSGPLDLNVRSTQALSKLNPSIASAPPTSTMKALAARPVTQAKASSSSVGHPILDRTLERAVAKGFVAAAEVPAVRNKVLTLAQRYNFKPDDFARLTLMESGGMNPQASNGNCHGIIQFCNGPNRGAASVGFKDNPRDILNMGLLQQLDLVDRYFSQAGLRGQGPALGLDDLYLAVLTPAARQETRPDAPLPIAGPQARYLHVDQNTQAPITRNSILAGLHSLTQSLLPMTAKPPAGAALGVPGKSQVARLYNEVGSNPPTSLR
jgi:hypothetical protein